MKIGLGIGVTQPQNMPMASVGSPSYLFRDGTQGTWYDPSDINLTWRRNLLTYSEQFDDAAWMKTATIVTANASIAPDGSLTADKIAEDSTTNPHQFMNSPVMSLSTTYTLSIYAKAVERNWIILNIYSGTASSWTWFNLSAGTVGTTGAGATAKIQSVGDGWYRCSITATTSASGSPNVAFWVSDNDGVIVYTGTSGSGIYIWGAQLELGSTATPYQRITDGIQDYLQYQAQPVLYRDAAGTTPVTGVEQPVGLMLDKSKGLVLGPELVTNGSCTGTTGWSAQNGTLSNPGGSTIRVDTNGSLEASVYNAFSVTGGKYYQVSFDLIGANNTGAVAIGGTRVALPGPGMNSGKKQLTILASVSSSNGVAFLTNTPSAGYYIEVDNISVRELPGNHAFNSSGNSANFPVLSARYNLLIKSEEFDDAAWTKSSCTITPNATTAPDGTLTADRAVFTAGGLLYANGLPTTAGTYIFSGYVKSATGSAQAMRIFGNGTLSYSGNLPVTTEWTWVSFTFTYSAATSGFATSSGQPLDIYIWGADLRVANDGVNLPAYQRVNTATDYDTVGFKPYLKFNGTNQWLQTNSIDFSYTDKMFVSAGVRKLSDSAEAILAELSSAANAGTFRLYSPRSALPTYSIRAGGSALVDVPTASLYAAPITNVASGVGDISTPSLSLRVNGAQVAQSTASQGTGNYGNYPLYIGARAGSSLWFNGRLYGMVVAGKQVSAVEIDKTEDYIALKTGFTYPSISGVPTFMVVL